jgi:Xaa-Pro aminopeptidase
MPSVHFADTSDSDMFYLVRDRVADPFFYIEREGKRVVYLSALELGAFAPAHHEHEVTALPLEPLVAKARLLEGGTALQKLALVIFTKHELFGSPVAVSKHFPLDLADYLRSHGATLTVTDIAPGRVKKNAEEIRRLRASAEAACRAFGLIESMLAESRIESESVVYKDSPLTSETLKREVELRLFSEGFENPAGIIVSSGAQSATPHHAGSGPLKANQTIVCDIFPRDRESGYFADMTRTYVKGVPSEQVTRMYEAVRDAQSAGIRAIRPGALAKDVYEAAAKIIRERGFDVGEKGFIHSLGHGVGLDVHETPLLSATSKDVLEPGMVVTVEPGLYYPERGGVRLEDMFVVTENGSEKLTVHRHRLTP